MDGRMILGLPPVVCNRTLFAPVVDVRVGSRRDEVRLRDARRARRVRPRGARPAHVAAGLPAGAPWRAAGATDEPRFGGGWRPTERASERSEGALQRNAFAAGARRRTAAAPPGGGTNGTAAGGGAVRGGAAAPVVRRAGIGADVQRRRRGVPPPRPPGGAVVRRRRPPGGAGGGPPDARGGGVSENAAGVAREPARVAGESGVDGGGGDGGAAR